MNLSNNNHKTTFFHDIIIKGNIYGGRKMSNIMVCVTGQKTCQRLINRGIEEKKSERDQLFIIHVAHKDYNFLGKSAENEALEYLYERAMAAGANLNVEKSEDVLGTLGEIANENKIDVIVVGESGENPGPDNFLEKLRNKCPEPTKIIEVAAVS